MVGHRFFKPGALLSIPLLVALMMVVACGADATPSPQPTPTPIDVASIVKSAVKEAVQAQPAPVSAAEIGKLVESAVMEIPAGASPEEIKSLVESVVIAATAGAATTAEVEELVTKAVAEAVAAGPSPLSPEDVRKIVREAISALPTATPAPIPTPVEVMILGPTGTLNVGYKEIGPYSAHPSITDGGIMLYVGTTMAETLISVTAKGEYLPKLATEWLLSSDQLTWTFKLQRGVPFHKGYGEMTSEDVIWSLTEFGAEESINGSAPHFRRLFLCDECRVTAIDKYTVEVNTGKPQYDMLVHQTVQNAGEVFSKTQVDEIGDDAASRNAAATGPWEIVEQRPGQFWKFRAVEGHWRKTPEFAELVLHEIPEESTRVANFQVGKLDSFQMSLDSKAAVEGVPGARFMRVDGGATLHVGIFGNFYVGIGTENQRPGYNPDLPYVSASADPDSEEWERAAKVRRAMSIAIDRDLIVKTLLGGEGRPLVLWGWESGEHRLDPDMVWEYDPDRARELLTEAGHGGGFEITMTPAIRGVPSEVEACEAIATMWENIGIRTTVNNIPFSAFVAPLIGRTYEGAACHGTSGRFEPLTLLTAVVPSTTVFNTGYEHPLVDDWIERAVNTVDTEARWAIQKEMARFVFDSALDLGIYTVNILWPLSGRVESWVDDLEYGDRRLLSATEFASHR